MKKVLDCIDMTRFGRSRRAILRGAGVAVALPWLESVSAWAATGHTGPKRLGVVFMGNGINGNHWWAKGAGPDLKLSKTLQPLAPFKERVNVIGGLFNQPAVGHGIHPPQTGNLLSGSTLQRGATVRGGITMDQVLANHIGEDTALPSMVLACEQPLTGYHETNFSMAYSGHISWQSAESPVPTEVYPAHAFDSLFENRGALRDASVLDRVKARAKTLSHKVGRADKAKLDEYLSSVRTVEKRIARLRTSKTPWAQSKEATNMKRPPDGLPEDFRDHTRLMCDILALAFQTDRTRIATLILCNDLSSIYYPFLDVHQGHHGASHDDLSDGYERICRFHISQFAHLANRLATMPEGDSTVLDNSCLIFLSNMWSGWKHDNMRLPVVTVGGLRGSLKTGRALEYMTKGDDNRRVCSLYLSLMDRMGVRLERFGDSDRRLAEI